MLQFGLNGYISLRFFAESIPLQFPVSAIARFIHTTYFYLCCCILTFLELMINQLLYAKKTHSMKQCILLLFKDIFSIICCMVQCEKTPKATCCWTHKQHNLALLIMQGVSSNITSCSHPRCNKISHISIKNFEVW